MKIGQKSMKIHNPKTPDLKIPNPTKIRRKFKRKSAKINENPEKSRKIPDPNKSEIRKSQQIRRKSANKISGWVKSDENLPLWVEFQVAPPGAAVARAGGAWKMEVSPGCCYCCTREARCVKFIAFDVDQCKKIADFNANLIVGLGFLFCALHALRIPSSRGQNFKPRSTHFKPDQLIWRPKNGGFRMRLRQTTWAQWRTSPWDVVHSPPRFARAPVLGYTLHPSNTCSPLKTFPLGRVVRSKQVAPPGAAVARAGGAWKMEVSPGCCYCCTREARCVFQNTLPNKCKWWQQNSRNDPRARRASNKLRRGTTFRNVSINTHWRTIRGQKKGVICWETPCFVGAASHSWPADQRVVAHPLKSRSCTMVIWARFFWAFFLEFEAVVDQNQTLVAPLKHLFPP